MSGGVTAGDPAGRKHPTVSQAALAKPRPDRPQALRGVYAILATPFLPDGTIDEASLRRLTAATVATGVDGVTVLGVAGEVQKLTDAERSRVLTVVIETVDGRVPVVAGTSRDGTDAAIDAAGEAEAAGATALMVAPPAFAQAGPSLTEHFQRIGAMTRLPIVLQDFPPANGVTLSAQAMSDLVATVPSIVTIKLEDPPTPIRIGQTLALIQDQATILGGLGGVYLLDELRRGSSGTMTGFAFPEILMAIWRAWNAGDTQAAMGTYYRWLPLIAFEGQPKIGLAIRKELLRRRGLIDYATVRQPAQVVNDGIVEDLNATLSALDLDPSRPLSDAALSR